MRLVLLKIVGTVLRPNFSSKLTKSTLSGVVFVLQFFCSPVYYGWFSGILSREKPGVKKMNLHAFLLGVTLSLVFFCIFFFGGSFIVAGFKNELISLVGFQDNASLMAMVGIVLYTSTLIGAMMYTEKQEQYFRPSQESQWGRYLLILLVFPFLLWLFFRQMPVALFLLLTLLLLARVFYVAVLRHEEVQEKMNP